MFKRCPVVILSANEKANTTIGLILKDSMDENPVDGITLYKKDNLSLIFGDYVDERVFKPQHLYFLSDEEIKEGDWYYTPYNSCPFGDTSGVNQCHNPKALDEGCHKIIASTDLSLFTSTKLSDHNPKFPEDADVINAYLPQPSQAFIEKYVAEYNKGNIIIDIDVEYELKPISKKLPFEYGNLIDANNPLNHQLKINSKDNTITIKKIKDSWNREELINLISDHEYDKGIVDWEALVPALFSEVGYKLSENWKNKK